MKKLIAAAGLMTGLAACSGGPGTVTIHGQVLAASDSAAYTAATAYGAHGLCDIGKGTKVTVTGARGQDLGWAVLTDYHPVRRLTGTASVGEYRFSVKVPAGQSHYGLRLAGIANTLSYTPGQLRSPVRISCG